MRLGASPSVSVVVPVYDGAATLTELVQRLQAVLGTECSEFEVILVDDGSRDNSWDVIVGLTYRFSFVRSMQLMRNYGQHNALLCGIRAAKNDVIITMDDDLQHPPEEIPKLLEKLVAGFDVVYGTPTKEAHGLLRDIASRITKIALRSAMGVATAQHVSAFRAIRTQVRQAFAGYSGAYISIDVLLAWGTTRFAFVVVNHNERPVGESGYTFGKLVRHAINMMTGFSVVPLQLASGLGFVLTLFGVCVLVYVIGRYVLEGTSVPGFPFLASVIAIFSGAQLFALGIIGEYIARIHFRTMGRPAFSVREDANPVHDAIVGRG